MRKQSPGQQCNYTLGNQVNKMGDIKNIFEVETMDGALTVLWVQLSMLGIKKQYFM